MLEDQLPVYGPQDEVLEVPPVADQGAAQGDGDAEVAHIPVVVGQYEPMHVDQTLDEMLDELEAEFRSSRFVFDDLTARCANVELTKKHSEPEKETHSLVVLADFEIGEKHFFYK